MKTESAQPSVFPQIVSGALTRLKQRLERNYEQVYPDLREVIHLVVDQEEAAARELSVFPHLLLPDLVEAHLARLNLQPVHGATERAVQPDQSTADLVPQPAFA